jgi:dTDP-4-amino-4,6-dideoxygalactose transaminase
MEAFSHIEDARLVREPEGSESNYWFQTLLLAEGVAEQRDPILEATNDAGLMTRPAWMLMHQLPPYRDCPRAPLPVAESLARRIINVPSSAGLA